MSDDIQTMIDAPSKIHDSHRECPECGHSPDVLNINSNTADWTCLSCETEFNGPEPRRVNGEWNKRKWRVYGRDPDSMLKDAGKL